MMKSGEHSERTKAWLDLHDDLQQILFAIRMNMNFILQDIEKGKFTNLLPQFSAVMKTTDSAIEKTRQLTADLNPSVLKSPQLTDIVNWLIRRFSERQNLNTELKVNKDFHLQEEEIRVVLLRSVRELLFNIVKHAGTDHATIEISGSNDDSHLALHVIDKGKGFDADEVASQTGQQEGFGLFSIRDRLQLYGGEMEIESVPGEGTHVTLQVPLDKNMDT